MSTASVLDVSNSADVVDPGHGNDQLIPLIVLVAEHHGYRCQLLGEDRLELVGDNDTFLYSVADLRRVVNEEPRDRWASLVADHVGSMFATMEASDSDRLDTDDFAAVRGLIRTRLYPANLDGLSRLVYREIAAGLVQVVVIDQPTSILSVARQLADRWPISVEALFDLAERNTRGDGPLDLVSRDHDGVRITILHSDTDYEYTSAHALWLGDYAVTGSLGAVFIVPREGVIYTHAIDDVDVVDATTYLAQLAVSIVRERPRQISPTVYHWRNNTIGVAADTAGDGDTITVLPSLQFIDTLDTFLDV